MKRRFFVCVFKNFERERSGFSYGENHDDALNRFLRARRQPHKGQLKEPVEMVMVGLSEEGGDLCEIMLYGPEAEGFPLRVSESLQIALLRATGATEGRLGG